jgi:2-polyprenyl-6-methoxyphenol hydroxylase-like FAD-dependent oxidoreductase
MKILISGGGIAGLTIANFLHRQGHQTILIDKATEFSEAGFVLSLKSFGVEIMRELGLEEKLRSKATKSNFVNFLKFSGEQVRQIDFRTINKNLPDSIAANRSHIHEVLYEAIKDNVEILFNTMINNVTQNEKEVNVQLSDNSSITADLLIVAEGIRSGTRAKIWTDSAVEDFNIFYAAGKLQGKHAYQTGNYLTYRGRKKILAILPLNDNELAIQCYIHDTANVDKLQDISKGLLSETFNDLDEKALKLLKQLEAKGGIFADKIGMVHEPVLNKGRVVLLGDAGYCPTALSGMGASLSIYGAKALAHYIDKSPTDLDKALANYNSLMQPIIEKFQSNARKNARTFLPMNKISLWLNNILLKYIPSSIFAKKISNELTLTKEQVNFFAD